MKYVKPKFTHGDTGGSPIKEHGKGILLLSKGLKIINFKVDLKS